MQSVIVILEVRLKAQLFSASNSQWVASVVAPVVVGLLLVGAVTVVLILRRRRLGKSEAAHAAGPETGSKSSGEAPAGAPVAADPTGASEPSEVGDAKKGVARAAVYLL